METDEPWSYVGKKRSAGCGGLIDRAIKKVCGGALGDRGSETARRLNAQLPHADPIPFRTDCWHPWGIIFEKHRHLQGKAHTFTLESHNNRLRCYLARLRRKPHCYTKKLANLTASILCYLLKNNINTYLAIPIFVISPSETPR
ncbi:MAG: hypothetical protein LBI02_08090 [Opitutaceae bacterium]|jgi:IS1 family transposase|nr:hypothetical protein [Opitutaceae bacterium]